MAISFFQKIRLALRGWSRRREDAGRRRDEEFLRRNVTWAQPAAPSPATAAKTRSVPSAVRADREGLQVAFLDDSGRRSHYLDLSNGDVVEAEAASPDSTRFLSQPDRFQPVPHRSDATETADRERFVEALDQPAAREALRVATADPASFRRAIAGDRTIERAWYNFKNDRASEVIEEWLQSIGIEG